MSLEQPLVRNAEHHGPSSVSSFSSDKKYQEEEKDEDDEESLVIGLSAMPLHLITSLPNGPALENALQIFCRVAGAAGSFSEAAHPPADPPPVSQRRRPLVFFSASALQEDLALGRVNNIGAQWQTRQRLLLLEERLRAKLEEAQWSTRKLCAGVVPTGVARAARNLRGRGGEQMDRGGDRNNTRGTAPLSSLDFSVPVPDRPVWWVDRWQMSSALPEGYKPHDMRHFREGGVLARAQSGLVGTSLAAASEPNAGAATTADSSLPA